MTPNGQQSPEPWPYVAADAHGWPAADGADPAAFDLELAKAKLEVRMKRTDQEIARAKAIEDSQASVAQAYYTAVLEVSKGSIDRARASADTVQKAAAAIVTLYTGILGLAFAAAEDPLPAKALFAAVFLGLAILLSTAFLAYLPDPEDDQGDGRLVDAHRGDELTAAFVRWSRRAALERGRLLRSSVVVLAGAIILLPAPFVTLGGSAPDDTAVSAQPAWPAPDPAAGEDPRLARIVYEAQVAEVAKQRAVPAAEDESYLPWWAISIATLLIAGAAYVWPRPKDGSDAASDLASAPPGSRSAG